MQKEDLVKYDFVVAIDASGSMGDPVGGTRNITRWQAAREVVHSITRDAAKYDDDGATVILFSSDSSHLKEFKNIADAVSKVDEIFDKNHPGGTTDTAGVLQHCFDDYLKRKRANAATTKPTVLFVFTDGRPDDEDAVIKNIVAFSKRLDNADEFGIQFYQIGDDSHAREFLKKLDDTLTKKYGAKFDIVDTENEEEAAGKTLEELCVATIEDDVNS
jgi:Mg-chelatase subunit ChlD